MKMITSILNLTLALTLTLIFAFTAKAFASEGGHEGHEELSKKMNSLFPTKEANLEDRKIPAKPSLTSPTYFSSIAGNTVKLTWSPGEGAEEYHIQVATDPNFKWLVAEDFSHKETSFEFAQLEAGKHYYWRVASVKPNNWKTFRKSMFATSMFETQAVK